MDFLFNLVILVGATLIVGSVVALWFFLMYGVMSLVLGKSFNENHDEQQ